MVAAAATAATATAIGQGYGNARRLATRVQRHHTQLLSGIGAVAGGTGGRIAGAGKGPFFLERRLAIAASKGV